MWSVCINACSTTTDFSGWPKCVCFQIFLDGLSGRLHALFCSANIVLCPILYLEGSGSIFGCLRAPRWFFEVFVTLCFSNNSLKQSLRGEAGLHKRFHNFVFLFWMMFHIFTRLLAFGRPCEPDSDHSSSSLTRSMRPFTSSSFYIVNCNLKYMRF